jgi:TolB protein
MPAPSVRPSPRRELRGETPIVAGDPIALDTLRGSIVFDDYEDILSMRADASAFQRLTSQSGAEFDAAWSPDGDRIAYRDSRRGINEDDEIYVMDADGSNVRNLSDDPANDWAPDWSPDGRFVVFNSDRAGYPLRGYLADFETGAVRPIAADGWFEYPAFSPDGTHLAYMGHTGSDYDIYVLDLATGVSTQLTDAPGSDGWPSWSPDGSTIAFATERDDCQRAPPDADCWRTGQPGEHHDIWLMDADGEHERRVTGEFGQFVSWSPDSQYLLISGHTLYVVRPDGTGRVEVRPPELSLPPGGIPDWGA